MAKGRGYYIAKYSHVFEADIYLKDISKEDIVKMLSEFGVPPDFELAQELGIPLDSIADVIPPFTTLGHSGG